MLFVGPGTASDGKLVGRNLLLLEIRKDEPGREINARVSVFILIYRVACARRSTSGTMLLRAFRTCLYIVGVVVRTRLLSIAN